MKSFSILLIDDDDAARNVFASVLKRASHDVTSVADGKDAIAQLGSGRFDVILTDFILPDVDGLEIITAAKSLQPDARIVAMSGGTSHLPPSFCLKLARAMGGPRR